MRRVPVSVYAVTATPVVGRPPPPPLTPVGVGEAGVLGVSDVPADGLVPGDSEVPGEGDSLVPGEVLTDGDGDGEPVCEADGDGDGDGAVSYTHLTLPTIYSV